MFRLCFSRNQDTVYITREAVEVSERAIPNPSENRWRSGHSERKSIDRVQPLVGVRRKMTAKQFIDFDLLARTIEIDLRELLTIRQY